MLVLQEGGAECDGVVGARVCAAAKARRHAVDGEACLDLGGDDVPRGIVGRTELLAGGEAERGRRGGGGRGRRGGEVAGDGGNLGEGEIGAGECDGGTRAVKG